jgi:hypothetical protein
MSDVPTKTTEKAEPEANGAPAKPTQEEVIARLRKALEDPESVPPMAVPPEIAELVVKRIGDFPVTEEDRRRITEDYCFQYHYGGKGIAWLKTSKGRVVIAHDGDEVSTLIKLIDSFPRGTKLPEIYLDNPEPW